MNVRRKSGNPEKKIQRCAEVVYECRSRLLDAMFFFFLYITLMPTYDYKCADCGRLFEKFHGMNEQPQVVCPECQSVNVFKGAGFYVNDYKKTDSGSGTKNHS